MLQYKETIVAKQLPLKYKVGYGCQVWQGIGWVGKDEIEPFATLGYEAEYVSLYGKGVQVLQLVDEAAYETVVQGVGLHGDDSSASATEQFEAYAAGSGEEVESRGLVIEVQIAFQHVEQVFLGKVRRGPCLEIAWYFKVPSLVFTCYHSPIDTFFKNLSRLVLSPSDAPFR